MGHATASFTLNVYSHMIRESTMRAAIDFHD